jgi:hypothetical protein
MSPSHDKPGGTRHLEDVIGLRAQQNGLSALEEDL